LNEGVEHEDVAIRLLAISLDEYSQRWFKGLPDNHLASYDNFDKSLTNRWSKNKDSGYC
jgi:hypothetical protein